MILKGPVCKKFKNLNIELYELMIRDTMCRDCNEDDFLNEVFRENTRNPARSNLCCSDHNLFVNAALR